MNRLITFGCSYTFGHSLDDCYLGNGRPGPIASKLAWPEQLAHKLNLRCINLGQSGAGNLEILNNILNYSFQPDDVVIVQWSFKDRDTIFHPTKGCIQIGPWGDYENLKEWTKVHSAYDLKIRSKLYMHQASLYLDSLTITFKFLRIEDIDNGPKWFNNIKFLQTNFKDVQEQFPKALDDYHPGTECHAFIANSIFDEIAPIAQLV
jgi:hypothetical protein